MKTAALLIVLIFAYGHISCKGKVPFEKEPNNSCGASNEFAVNSEIRGYINTTTDKDFFKIDVKEDTLYRVKLSGIKGVNLSVKLWKWKNRPLLLKMIDDNRKSSPEEFANFYAEAGTYCISIEHGDRDIKKSNTETPYRLTLKSRDPEIGEREPNDTPRNATLIDDTGEIKGYFSPAFNRMNLSQNNKFREEDWYRIDVRLEEEKPVVIDIELSGVDRVNSQLFFYDENKRLISGSDKNGSGSGENLTGIGIKRSGTYYIMAASKNYSYNNDEAYQLYYRINEYDPSREIEPNNKPDSANTIDHNSITGRINGPGDFDFYRFVPQSENVYYRIKVEPAQGLDIKFSLLDPERKKLFEINNGGTGKNEIFPDFISSKAFYILVKAGKVSSNGEPVYVVTVDEFRNDENMEIEPNNDKTKSNSIEDDHITGYISEKNDKDFYVLNYEDRVNSVFEVTGVKSGKIRVSITDPLGFIIKTVEVTGDERVVFSEMINRKAYIIVESLKDNYDFPYNITIDRR